MEICTRCKERPITSKELCKRCYYRDYQSTPEYKAKASARCSARWKSSPELRERNKLNLRKYKQEKMEQISKFVPSTCALQDLGPCNDRGVALHRDHDHHCTCGRVKGCQNCFRGLLCDYHNRTVLPMVGRWNEQFIPKLIKDYLIARPLKGTGIDPGTY